MQILSLETEDRSSILERNGLLYAKKNEPLQELEEAIQESTSDLPISKAIHLLLHIHSQVLDKAITALKASSPNQHISLIADSPTIRSILSLEHYLTSNNISTHFRHLYDPLKEKILKKTPNESTLRLMCYFLLYSSYRAQIQQFFVLELESTEKRSQLATVIILQYVYDNYLLNEDEPEFPYLFIPNLVKLTNTKTPTLLACHSCEAALNYCKYTLNNTKHEAVQTLKIVEVESTDISSQTLESFRKNMDILLDNLETWQKNKSDLEIVSYKELHRLLFDTHYPTIFTQSWNFILSFMSPKKILQAKPLHIKKQEEIIDFPDIASNTKMIILALLQKGQWIESYAKEVVVLSSDEERIKASLVRLYCDMNFALPGGHLIPVIATLLPYLCSTNHITNIDTIRAILERVEEASDNTFERWKPLVLNQPEACICQFIFHVVQQDEKSNFSFEFLSFLISKEPDEFVPLLLANLFSVLKSSNQACELLIQCMPHTNLILLIQKLMKLVFTAEDKNRERMIYIALISKALLDQHWASDSILIYLDLIRGLKFKKKLIFTESIETEKLKALTPYNVTQYQHNQEFPLSDQDIESAYPALLGSIQLWSSKVDNHTFEIALKQLVQYSYGIPEDNTCIEAWKNLSFAFLNNHALVWYAIEPCLNIMKTQLTITDDLLKETTLKSSKMKESILFLRLNPMLILQTIPKEAYDIVQLPPSYIHLKQEKLESIGVDPRDIKVCNKHSKISIELMDELLQRSFETKNLGGSLQNPVDFSISLLVKIFCK